MATSKANRRLVQLIRRVALLVASNEAIWAEVQAYFKESAPGTEDLTSATIQAESYPTPPNLSATPEPQEATSRDVQIPIIGDTALTAARCRLKFEGCRWAFERQRLKANGADHTTEIAPGDRSILEAAKGLPDCHLWMNSPSAPVTDDGSLYLTVAGCFEALAAVLTIVATSHEIITADRHLFADVLKLVAEAQSAVREAVRRVGGPNDSDQVEAFWWVRNSAAKAGIFIERYMRDEDAADPNDWNERLERINEMAGRVKQRGTEIRRRRRLFEKLRYQLEQVVSGDDDGLWETVARTLDELIVDGVPPSNLRLRELLLPHLDVIPQIANPPRGFELVLRETRRFQESLVEDPPEEDATEFIPIIEAAAEMLQGQAVLLIGGETRPDVKAAIEQKLRLTELLWMPIKHGQHVSIFEQYVARPDVIVVLLAIRWSSHSCTDVRHICRKYNKPLVRLPGGYSPNQVATQIINQCSWRLKQCRQRAS